MGLSGILPTLINITKEISLVKINDIIKETPLPQDWDKTQLDSSQSFKSRIDYAVSKSKKIGSGSSRVVFSIPYQGRVTALKIAKNSKGMAQNTAEVDLLSDNYIKMLGIVIPLIDFDEDNSSPIWLQTERAEPVTSVSQLNQLLSAISVKYLVGYAEYLSGNRLHPDAITQDEYISLHRDSNFSDEEIEHSLVYADAFTELKNYDVNLADLTRYQNWGIWQGKPVIIDLGLTSAVHARFYK